MAKKKKVQTASNYLLIDDSGSMSGRANDVRKGVDAYIAKMKVEVPDSKLTIAYFGTGFDVVASGPIATIRTPLYRPNQNQTALYSGIVQVVNRMLTDEADNKSLTIATDGLENVNYMMLTPARNAILTARNKDMMIGLLATGVDSKQIANQLGIDQDLSSNFATDNAEVAIGTMSDVSVSYSKGVRRGLTSLERAAIEKSPEEIAKAENEELVTLPKLQKLLKKMYEEDAGQFFSVCFKSRTPPYKTRTYGKARFNVPSKVKGEAGQGAAYSPLEKNLVACYVLDKYSAEDVAGDPKGRRKEGEVTGFRSVPLEGIIALRAGGKAFRVKTGG